MKSILMTLVLVLVTAPAFAQHLSAPKPKPSQSRTVWVLMLMDNQGAKVSVGCVRRTQAEALACIVPPPSADRVSVAVPTMYVHGGAK